MARFVLPSAVDAYMDAGGKKRLQQVFEGSRPIITARFLSRFTPSK